MKLATVRVQGATHAVRVEGDTFVDLGYEDVGELLAVSVWPDVAVLANGPAYAAEDIEFAPLVTRPSKVVCVGLNYRNHILELGMELPEYPTLFCKFSDALIGANDDIMKPAESEAFDWEAELALVIGKTVRRATDAEAAAAVAGFTVLNDISCRDWQFRTQEWLQGKTWDSTTPVGPFLVTPDELQGGVRPALDISLTVDGEVMQSDTTEDLVFDTVALVRYVSTVVRLNPGDIISTGTPGGVGHARKPPVYLQGGETVVAEIAGIGRLENRIVVDGA
jgi:acylpyruvate hydrolase